ncbi:alpha/beta fold hydrolase [Halorarius litoreus]|uniref:alpha/beta fold hydrolase n=1 Tax=Halorarius litoreus TaxID=2962676 RepID=UPI0020CCF4A5|nr:alpha/beta hydrolase [Halorarius litoreus]
MEYVDHHGRETAYRATDFGDGAPVLYIHGSGGYHRVWTQQYGPDGVGPAAAVDLTGHGESADIDLAAGIETLDAYADDVVAVAEETGARTLVGNSLGGGVALWVALERDLPLDALVLCGTGAKLGVGDDLLEMLDSAFEAGVEAVHSPGLLFHDADQETVERSKEQLLETGAKVTARDFRTCDAFDVRDRLDEVEVPALAITGEHDGMTPPSFTEYLGEHLPNCETAILEDCAHLSMVERPEAWNEQVRAFLAD